MSVKHTTAADGTFSAGGATAWDEAHTIESGTITLAMQANMDTASVVYRKTAGSGAPEVNTLATLKTDLGLTGTNSGDQTSIVGISGTIAQFNTACSDADFATGGGTATGTNTGDQTNITGNAATVTTNANLTGHVTSVGNAAVLGSFTLAQLNTAVSDANVASIDGTETLTNKRITQRVVAVSDTTTYTPTGDTADVNTQANTQATGTLTMAAPTGTPTSGQKLILRIKSTNVQTYSWNAIYRGSTDLALPTTSSGATKTDYYGFIYNSADTKWDLVAKVAGF